jgi:hypothetical protein
MQADACLVIISVQCIRPARKQKSGPHRWGLQMCALCMNLSYEPHYETIHTSIYCLPPLANLLALSRPTCCCCAGRSHPGDLGESGAQARRAVQYSTAADVVQNMEQMAPVAQEA